MYDIRRTKRTESGEEKIETERREELSQGERR